MIEIKNYLTEDFNINTAPISEVEKLHKIYLALYKDVYREAIKIYVYYLEGKIPPSELVKTIKDFRRRVNLDDKVYSQMNSIIDRLRNSNCKRDFLLKVIK